MRNPTRVFCPLVKEGSGDSVQWLKKGSRRWLPLVPWSTVLDLGLDALHVQHTIQELSWDLTSSSPGIPLTFTPLAGFPMLSLLCLPFSRITLILVWSTIFSNSLRKGPRMRGFRGPICPKIGLFCPHPCLPLTGLDSSRLKILSLQISTGTHFLASGFQCCFCDVQSHQTPDPLCVNYCFVLSLRLSGSLGNLFVLRFHRFGGPFHSSSWYPSVLGSVFELFCWWFLLPPNLCSVSGTSETGWGTFFTGLSWTLLS